MSEGYLIGPNLLGRIRRVVDDVEAAPMKTGVTRIETRFEGEDAPRQAKVIRVGTYVGDWAPGESKAVSFKYQTANTVTVLNLTHYLPLLDPSADGIRDCVIVKEASAWFLVSAIEHSIKRGSFIAPWARGYNKTVYLDSGGSVEAINRHVSIDGAGSRSCTIGRDGMTWELIAAGC